MHLSHLHKLLVRPDLVSLLFRKWLPRELAPMWRRPGWPPSEVHCILLRSQGWFPSRVAAAGVHLRVSHSRSWGWAESSRSICESPSRGGRQRGAHELSPGSFRSKPPAHHPGIRCAPGLLLASFSPASRSLERASITGKSRVRRARWDQKMRPTDFNSSPLSIFKSCCLGTWLLSCRALYIVWTSTSY